MEILDTSVNAVNLHLGGSGALIKSIRPEQIRVIVDLSKAVAGRNTFAVTQENITLPPGVFLKKIKPAMIEATLDTPIKKRLIVQVDWTGKLPDHLTLASAKIDPENVEVLGGKKILEKATTIYTEKVALDNIDKSGVMTANLALTPASLKIAEGSKNKVTIRYKVKKRDPR
jgi:YbbR domain-containing protein